MDERNDANQERGRLIDEENLRDFRGVAARDTSIERADREDYEREIYDKSDDSLLSRFAKVAGLGIAAYAGFRHFVPKDAWIDAANKLGLVGKRSLSRLLDKRDQSIARALGTAPRPSRRLGYGTKLTDVLDGEVKPFVQDLQDHMVHGSAIDQARLRSRQILENRFGARVSGSNRHRVMTVSDILDMAKRRDPDLHNVIDPASLDILNRSKAWFSRDKSTWFDKLVLDNNLYVSNAGKVADLRMFDLGHIGKGIKSALSRPLPFSSFSPYSIVRPFVDLFGKGPSFSRVGNSLRIADNVKTPGNGVNYLIGGKLVNFQAQLATAVAPNRNFTAQSFDALGIANAARLGILPSQSMKPSAGFWGKVQDLIGIGTKYRTEAQAFSRVGYAARVHEEMNAGKKVFRNFTHIKAKDLGFMQKLRMQIRTGSFDPEAVVPNPHANKSFNQLPFFERIKHSLGFGKLGDFSTTKTDGWFGTKTVPHQAVTGLRNLRPGELSASGAKTVPIENYAVENTLGNKLNLLAHHATVRLNNLIGATTGLGFRPSKGSFGWINNAVKIGILGLTFNPIDGLLVDAASYVNYLFRQATSLMGIAPWDGFGPLDVARGTYKYASLGFAGIKDITGVTAASKYAEGLMPGLVNSPLSGMARTGGAIGAGLILGGRRGALIGLGAAAVSGSLSDVFGIGGIAGANTTMSRSELSSYYSGDKRVPVKSGRWWGFGRSSFYGEGVERYAPHWMALAGSDWQYTSTLYGSQAEYFQKQSLLPTPHNLLGLLRDKNYFADKHRSSRPYPYDADGNLMHEDLGIRAAPSLPKRITQEDISALGYSPIVPSLSEPGIESSPSIRAKKSFDDLTEYLGIYKFLGETVFGRMETGPVHQSAENITSNRRLYWDKDVGGSFGMTEMLRRYMPQPNSIGVSEYINNIPNEMPSWMPGSRSVYEADRNYFKDFTVGDPYSKVKGGEYRLPGEAYEAVNKLHSGQKGVYDEVDAFKILADVAPYSTAFKTFARQVSNTDYGPDTNQAIQDTLAEKANVMQGYALDFRKRRFTGSKDSLAAINAGIQYNAAERMAGAVWEKFSLDAVPEISRTIPFGGIISNKLFANHTAEEDYLYRQVYGAKFSDWTDPYGTFVKPKLLTLYNENPLTATAGGAGMGFVLGSSPVGKLASAAIGGAGMGSLSAVRAAAYGRAEGGYIPGARRNEEEVIDYFDKLEFLRFQRSKEQAEAIGRPDIARKFKVLQSTRTMVGMNVSDPMMGMGAIPKPERFYMDSFLNASPSERQSILDLTPNYMDDVYMRYWGQASRNATPNSIVNSYFENNEVPGDSWEGWNPGVQKWQIMSRTMDTPNNSAAIDLHRQHISTNMQLQARDQYPDIGLDIGSIQEDNRLWLSSTREKVTIDNNHRRLGFRGRVNSFTQPSNTNQPIHNSNIGARRDRRYATEGYR